MNKQLIKNINAAADDTLVDVCLTNGLLSANLGTLAELKQLVNDLAAATTKIEQQATEIEKLRTSLQFIANTGKVSHCPAKSWDAIGKLEQRCNRLVGIASNALKPKENTKYPTNMESKL